MKQKLFHLKPWTPEIKGTAEQLVSQIKSVAPDLEVLFMGAAALELPGKNDIDLDILCPKSELAEQTKKLIPVLGAPTKQTHDLTAWNFMIGDFEIDCILSDPKYSHVPEQRAVFEALKASADLRTKYRLLKEACDGLPYEEYEQRKKAFFSSVQAGR